MRLLRSILSGLFFLAYGSLALVFAPVIMLPVLPPRTLRLIIRVFYGLFVACARVTGLFRVEIDDAGRAVLASLHGAIIVMNHVSLIDIVVILAHIPDATAIAKSSVLANPFLSTVARRMFILNDGDAKSVIAAAGRHLAEGTNIVIFPQGTRGGRTLHRGAAHLALLSRAQVRLVRIGYDPVVLAKGQPWWDVGSRTIRISLQVLPQISFTAQDSHVAARELTDRFAIALACR